MHDNFGVSLMTVLTQVSLSNDITVPLVIILNFDLESFRRANARFIVDQYVEIF